jgi:hypothetical protein
MSRRNLLRLVREQCHGTTDVYLNVNAGDERGQNDVGICYDSVVQWLAVFAHCSGLLPEYQIPRGVVSNERRPSVSSKSAPASLALASRVYVTG